MPWQSNVKRDHLPFVTFSFGTFHLARRVTIINQERLRMRADSSAARPHSRRVSRVLLTGVFAAAALTASSGSAVLLAQTPSAPAAAGDAPKSDTAAPANWSDTLKFSGHIEAGITGNPDDPSNGINFGHLFTEA